MSGSGASEPDGAPKEAGLDREAHEHGRLDPVTLSVLASALAGIAEEMGALLVRGGYSANIKERRDCSAALFDARGLMVAQAEHIPVHLGAMPEAVAAVMERDPEPGDVFVLNDPYTGGTHLPDLTLVSLLSVPAGSPAAPRGEPAAGGRGEPAADRRAETIGYAVTRAHHSDIGGMRPGSMPSDSREIYQEGLVIPPVRLLRRGAYVADTLDLILANVRTPETRRGDLRAQVAANQLAQRRLDELVARRGLDVVRSALTEVLAYAERRARQEIAALPDGTHRAYGEIEGDGVEDRDVAIEVEVRVRGEELEIDFERTAGRVAGNVNCPLAVTRSACYFALRALFAGDVPVNAGTYAPLSVRAPAGSLVNAQLPSAVVAGNVETSQRIADTVLLALAEAAGAASAAPLPAQGQGTMNNLVIGGRGWTYYETVGGGQGASEQGPGASGVHVGMSNTLNTPVEALELELPLRIERYELRRGSGGEGVHRGGDGVVRAVRVLEPASLSLLTDRRRHEPAGANGGGPGSAGQNLLNGRELPPKTSCELAAGDLVELRTPGGGGWGAPASSPGNPGG